MKEELLQLRDIVEKLESADPTFKSGNLRKGLDNAWDHFGDWK